MNCENNKKTKQMEHGNKSYAELYMTGVSYTVAMVIQKRKGIIFGSNVCQPAISRPVISS